MSLLDSLEEKMQWMVHLIQYESYSNPPWSKKISGDFFSLGERVAWRWGGRGGRGGWGAPYFSQNKSNPHALEGP